MTCHAISSDEGTSYCPLAEKEAKENIVLKAGLREALKELDNYATELYIRNRTPSNWPIKEITEAAELL